MAGLVDEIFLHIVEWDDVDIWNENLLETRLFDSYIAGEQIFRNLDKLLQERNPVYADLARIYLIALSLGFQGKHRNTSDTQQLDEYRQQLFKFISQREPEGLYENLQFNEDKHIFPQAYANTITEDNAQSLPSLRPWFLAFILVLLSVLIGSNYFWHHYTDTIDLRINDILLDRSLEIDLEQNEQGN
jgi:type VI secretion system protein ImpK